METINWKIEGMTCPTCALTINKYLERKGLLNIKVSLASGDVSFDSTEPVDSRQLRAEIRDLGYTVMQEEAPGAKTSPSLNKHLRYFLFCLPFTVLLLLHMVVSVHWLMLPWVQLICCIPVYVTGMYFFGRSAWKSIVNGLPNMNVLIATGATAAFIYSLTGTILGLGPAYLFYETTASIITIVFLGYYMEDASIRSTQRSLNALVRSQKTTATMIAFDDQHQEVLFPVENNQLRSGDLILVRSGEQVPADCKILWGAADVNESIITGESLPLGKKAKDLLIGGSILIAGTVKAQVTAAASDSILAGIIRQVRQAQGEKPPVQQLADRISAIFVPAVLGVALVTFLGNYIFLHAIGPSLLRAIGVLVIACPCAMGLATPAAIAVGLGRATRQGILFRNARSLESFKNIRQVVFDKTGTLTTGEFSIENWGLDPAASLSADQFKQIAFSLEKYSNHPIARGITREWHQKAPIYWSKIEEIKGMGLRAETKTGDVFWAGSYKVIPGGGHTGDDAHAPEGGADAIHSVYVVRNDRLLGWIDVRDTIRPEAAEIVRTLHSQGIHTILLSGDRSATCHQLAATLGIREVFAERSPVQKEEKITQLTAACPTAMVGDGINDAPALARATIGISMSDASQLAMQTADVVLMNHGLRHLPLALGLGRHTFATIRQNLFWAFFYNVIAIPVAALGWLTPTLAALVMGFSDVVLAINSGRLYVKKVI